MKVNEELLMTIEEGMEWHEFKALCGPLYPGYQNFDRYMNWVKDKLQEYGCVDVMEHHWVHESYKVNDWPVWDSGAFSLKVNNEVIPVGTFLMFSASTSSEGLTAPMVYYDVTLGEPAEGAFEGKIVVMEEPPMPQKPYDEKFLESYVVTDTNYRSGPEPPAPMLEIVDPTVNNSWNTRWAFSHWAFDLVPYATKGKAIGIIIASKLTSGTLKGLYDRQMIRPVPSLVVDRTNGPAVVTAAKEGKIATIKLISEFFPADAWNFVCFLPGADYGTDKDEYITINVHTDAMSLTQDNGSLGAIGIARYFSKLPKSARRKTLLFCIDSRHFIEGFENKNFIHDPYRVFPDLKDKVTVTIGLEHLGEMEGAEDYENNTMIPTGRPEYSFMKADDNDFCARILIEAVIDSGLERADVKIDGRPGIHGLYKGLVRAVQASTHRLGVCTIGEAGNWCGAHTQTFSTLQYFNSKKFRDEVHTWSQVVLNMMGVDSVVYDIIWSRINSAIRKFGAHGRISAMAQEGLLSLLSSIFVEVESGEYSKARNRLNNEFRNALITLLIEEDRQSVLNDLELAVSKISKYIVLEDD